MIAPTQYDELEFKIKIKFKIRKWIEVNDLSGGQNSFSKNIRFKTSLLRSDLCDFSDAYIVAKGEIAVKRDNNANIENEQLIFKNNAPFRSCISKINNTFIYNSEYLDIDMSVYNFLEYMLFL